MMMCLGLTLEGKPYGIILLLFPLPEFICKAGLCECQWLFVIEDTVEHHLNSEFCITKHSI